MAEQEIPIRATESLPSGTCYPDEQSRLVAFAGAMAAVLPGLAFYNYGSTKPDPEFNSYPWFRTTDSRWYFYSGGWIALNPERDPNIRRIFRGDSTDLITYDGGDNNAPSDRSGPMWEVDTEMSGRVAVGAGTLQPSGTVIAVDDTGGVDEVTLTDAEVPATAINPLDSNSQPIGDKTVQKSGDGYGFVAQNGDFSGSGSGGRMTDILLQVAGSGGAHENMPPYMTVLFIKPTSRLYYLVP